VSEISDLEEITFEIDGPVELLDALGNLILRRGQAMTRPAAWTPTLTAKEG